MHVFGSSLIQIEPRAGTVNLSRGRTAFVSKENGEVDPRCDWHGLYVYETRVLGRYLWTMNGKPPEFSCGSNVEQNSWLGYFIQSPSNCDDIPTRECDPLQETVEFRLSRTVGEGMCESVFVKNYTQIATSVTLELRYKLDFVSQDEVKSGRKQHGRLNRRWSMPQAGVWEQMVTYRVQHRFSHQGNRGTAHLHRGIKLRIEDASSPPRYHDGRIAFDAQLAPHSEWRVRLRWIAFVEGQELRAPEPFGREEENEWGRRRKVFFEAATAISAPKGDELTPTVRRVVQRAAQDLGDLRMFDLDSPGGITVAAGIPTYLELFGRDTEISAWQAAMMTPKFLRGCLNVFSKLPATETNDWRDAQPGRIPHQIQTDPVSVLNFRPLSLYFGSVSGSFLYPVVVAELWRWSGNLDELRPYIPTAIDAIKWADTYSLDSTGFYRYKSRSTQGLKNQGWKDSDDAIVYPDGSQVSVPLGACEMQGFMYAAKTALSEILWRIGDRDAARRLYREAEELKSRFNEEFWMPEENFFALGIDNEGKLIRSVASDPGHCLLAGIVDEPKRKQVANRLMQDDLFSGWGIRTLSSNHPAYNPFSYHRGTVWPVACANFVLAFGYYGLHAEMHQLSKAIFDVAALFHHHRLPEVFGGHARTPETPFPGLYTRANWPQAWSASAPIAMLQALLGICPYAPASLLLLDPHLPDWLPQISIEDLRIGKASVSLDFWRNPDGSTEYQVKKLKGLLNVVRYSEPRKQISAWVEQVDEFTTSLKN